MTNPFSKLPGLTFRSSSFQVALVSDLVHFQVDLLKFQDDLVLQIIYEFFLRFVESPEFDANVAKTFLTKRFINRVRTSSAFTIDFESSLTHSLSFTDARSLR